MSQGKKTYGISSESHLILTPHHELPSMNGLIWHPACPGISTSLFPGPF